MLRSRRGSGAGPGAAASIARAGFRLSLGRGLRRRCHDGRDSDICRRADVDRNGAASADVEGEARSAPTDQRADAGAGIEHSDNAGDDTLRSFAATSPEKIGGIAAGGHPIYFGRGRSVGCGIAVSPAAYCEKMGR